MPKRYKLFFDVRELTGLDDRQSYDKGYSTGLNLDYRTERTIERARNEIVEAGLVAYENWEKTGDFKYVLLHEYIRGLNHGLQQRALKLSRRRVSKKTGEKTGERL